MIFQPVFLSGFVAQNLGVCADFGYNITVVTAEEVGDESFIR